MTQYRFLRTALAAGITLGAALSSAFAQAQAPAPSPFVIGGSRPPVTSSSANGNAGTTPVAPRADQVRPDTKIDTNAAEAAALRDKAPVKKASAGRRAASVKPQRPATGATR